MTILYIFIYRGEAKDVFFVILDLRGLFSDGNFYFYIDCYLQLKSFSSRIRAECERSAGGSLPDAVSLHPALQPYTRSHQYKVIHWLNWFIDWFVILLHAIVWWPVLSRHIYYCLLPKIIWRDVPSVDRSELPGKLKVKMKDINIKTTLPLIKDEAAEELLRSFFFTDIHVSS